MIIKTMKYLLKDNKENILYNLAHDILSLINKYKVFKKVARQKVFNVLRIVLYFVTEYFFSRSSSVNSLFGHFLYFQPEAYI